MTLKRIAARTSTASLANLGAVGGEWAPSHGDAMILESLADLPRSSVPWYPRIIMLLGRRGKGKTATMTAVGAAMAAGYERDGQGKRVYANYIHKLAHVCDPDLVAHLTNPLGTNIRDGLLLIDEIQESAAARKSLTRVNVSMGMVLTQLRKLNLEAIVTTQNAAQIDRWVLWQIDYFVEAEMWWNGKGINLYVHDWHGNIMHQRKKRYWPPMKEEADWMIPLEGTQWVFGQYFDQQRVNTAYVDEEVRALLADKEWGRFGFDPQEWLREMSPDLLSAPGEEDDPTGEQRPSADSLTPTGPKPEVFDLREHFAASTSLSVSAALRALKAAGYFAMEANAGDFGAALQQIGFRVKGDTATR